MLRFHETRLILGRDHHLLEVIEYRQSRVLGVIDNPVLARNSNVGISLQVTHIPCGVQHRQGRKKATVTATESYTMTMVVR